MTIFCTDWAFKKYDDPYTTGAAPYVDQAVGWARQTGLKVVIDLHGGVGSQNGFDNSGHNGTVGFGYGGSVSQTRGALQLLANKYAAQQYQDVVVAIELLNEPLISAINGGDQIVPQYYKDTYGDVRVVSDTPVIIHDGFENGTYWNGVLSQGGANTAVDHHEYQCFTEDLLKMNPEVSRQYSTDVGLSDTANRNISKQSAVCHLIMPTTSTTGSLSESGAEP